MLFSAVFWNIEETVKNIFFGGGVLSTIWCVRKTKRSLSSSWMVSSQFSYRRSNKWQTLDSIVTAAESLSITVQIYSIHIMTALAVGVTPSQHFLLVYPTWREYHAPEKVWETLCSNRFNLKQQQKRDKQQKRSALASEEFWFIKKQREHVVLWRSGRRRQGILVQWCHLVDWMVQSGLRGLYCGHQSVSFKKTVFEVKRRFEGLQSIRDLGRFLSKYKMAPGTARLLSAARSEAGY